MNSWIIIYAFYQFCNPYSDIFFQFLNIIISNPANPFEEAANLHIFVSLFLLNAMHIVNCA